MTRTFVFAMVLLAACTSSPASIAVPSNASTPTPIVFPTSTLLPAAAFTAQPTATATSSPTAPPTAAPTRTGVQPSPSPQGPGSNTPTPLPTPTIDPVTCAELDTPWQAADWAGSLQILDRLQAAGLTCGERSLDGKRYAAHVNYALALEEARVQDAAVAQYQAALAVNGRGVEAIEALVRLGALPAPTAPACSPGELGPYAPSAQSFVSAAGQQLTLEGEPFVIRGVNYYPRHAPWKQFLTEGSLGEIVQELELIAAAGFNTLRIFLWYDPLFTCAPESATPNPSTFARLDLFMALAAQYRLRLIVTLNDLPDLLFRPLYTDYARYDAQTAFIVNRYRDEPAILAWDLRNEGDIDYGLHPSFPKRFERETVLDWLAHTAEIVRAGDDRHLLTAGWWNGSLATADIVDIVSFHHWKGPVELENQLSWLERRSSKPILIEEVGYSTAGRRDETGQAQALKEVISAAEGNGAAGWLIWTAFDFVPAEGQPPNLQHGYGLWRADLTPKPALEVLPLAAP